MNEDKGLLTNLFELLKPLFELLLANIFFGVLALLLVLALSLTKRAAYAVLKRNFLGYFSNPTGYVFLCLFVLLTSMAAFWPHEFFNSNLATLDQLNKWFPIIMMFFIPAITMSIWADEKRQGTDELLLTLPADDFDIVIGKYLAAASIYTVSLLFSQVSTFLVLLLLSKGDLDVGLFFANYLGYWFVGLAMLSIGMVASFLTPNLTVGFILGALFNAPLAFASMSDVIVPKSMKGLAGVVSIFGIDEQFDNFGRGVVSISSIAYFSLVVVFGLYFCMVLIGRRHWSGGKDGNTMFMHYLTRIVLMALIVFGVSYFFRNNDRLRKDLTQNQVSSLSPTTINIIRQLKPERPIVIDAYISADIPEQYSKTKYDLITLLKEFRALATSRGVDLQVRINDELEPSSEEAALAEKQYGIEPQMVRVRERGAFRDQKVLLGAAVRSGLSKVVVPFFESGIPVEYELVRSINTVAQPKRSKLGVVKTDAQLMGGFSMAGGGFSQIPKQPIIEELEKQYEVVEVDPTTPISTDQFNVLLAVQPSSLGPQELNNFLEAVKAGVPTAIFEDPMPFGFQGTPGTGEPKQAQGGGMFGGGQPPQPKGDITQLWKLLGLEIPIKSSMAGVNPDIVWQQYNPYPKLRYIMNATDEWIFIRENPGEDQDFLSEQSEITAGLRELMFLYAGAIKKEENRDDVKITNLISTRENAGRIAFEDVQREMRSGQASSTQLQLLQGPAMGSQVLGAYIESANVKDKDAAGMRVVYIADIDCMLPIFSEIRKHPEQYEEVDFRFQNVTLILNVIDVLAGEIRYPQIRRHEPQHSTLALFEEHAEGYRQQERDNQKNYQEQFNKEIREAEEQNQKTLAKFQEKAQALQREGATDPGKQQELIQLLQQVQMQQAALDRKLQVRREQMESERDKLIEKSRRDAESEVIKLQTTYKALATILPIIPPLLVGAGVFVSRRVREREGISKSRLR
jgi:ABC-2 type transport system permease protein